MKNKIVTVDFINITTVNLNDQVSLREVHAKLIELGGLTGADPFANWVKERLQYYVEGKDFFSFLEKTKKPKGGRPALEYYTSVQIAMEILANGHGEVGHQMRQFMSAYVRMVVEGDIPKMSPYELAKFSLDNWGKEIGLRQLAETKMEEHKAVIEEHKADPHYFCQGCKSVGLQGVEQLPKHSIRGQEAKTRSEV